MNRRVRINNLKIRVPSTCAGSPEQLAVNVAHKLSAHAGNWEDSGSATVKARVNARPTTSASLAEAIAGAVNRAVKAEEA